MYVHAHRRKIWNISIVMNKICYCFNHPCTTFLLRAMKQCFSTKRWAENTPSYTARQVLLKIRLRPLTETQPSHSLNNPTLSTNWRNGGEVLLYFDKFSLHYLPKFTFWQVCWFNGLSVCLSACLSLYKITDISQTLWDIFTKISPQMYLGCSSIVISFQGQRSKVNVMRSPQRSKLEIAVTPLIFELQQHLKKNRM